MRSRTLGRIQILDKIQVKIQQLRSLVYDLKVSNNTLRNTFSKENPFEDDRIAGYKPHLPLNQAKQIFNKYLTKYKKSEAKKSDDEIIETLIQTYARISYLIGNMDYWSEEGQLIQAIAYDWWANMYWKTPTRKQKFLAAWRYFYSTSKVTPIMMKLANATVDGQLDKEGLLGGLGDLSASTLEVDYEVAGCYFDKYSEARKQARILKCRIVARVHNFNRIKISVPYNTSDREIKQRLRAQEYEVVCGEIMSVVRCGYGEFNGFIYLDGIKYFYTFVDSYIILHKYEYIN